MKLKTKSFTKFFGLDYYKAKDGSMKEQFPRDILNALHLRWFVLTLLTFRNPIAIYLHRFVSGDYVLKTKSGVEFTVSNKNSALPIIVGIFHYKEYGELRDIGNSPTIVDLGANIGAFTLFALSRIPKARVYAYEPNPDSFRFLTKSVERNGFTSRATLVNKAVAGTEGVRTLYVTKELSGTDTLYDHRPDNRPVEVLCITLERIFEENGISICDLMKVDVEGAEYEILLSAPDHILSRIKKIVMEWHLIDPRYGINDLTSFLRSKGFVIKMDTPFRGILTATNPRNTA